MSPLLAEGNKAKVTGEVNQRYSECPENGECFIEEAVFFIGTWENNRIFNKLDLHYSC